MCILWNFLFFNFINRPFQKIFSNPNLLTTPARLAWQKNYIAPAGVAVLAGLCHATVVSVAKQHCQASHSAGAAKRFRF
jgi:hypothetical protein